MKTVNKVNTVNDCAVEIPILYMLQKTILISVFLFQHDMKLVSELCQKRLEQAVRMPGLRQDVFQQLLAEKLS